MKKRVNGARAWGYVRPDNWPLAEDDDESMDALEPLPVQPSGGDVDDVPYVFDDEPF